jgi:hypothetical protein
MPDCCSLEMVDVSSKSKRDFVNNVSREVGDIISEPLRVMVSYIECDCVSGPDSLKRFLRAEGIE